MSCSNPLQALQSKKGGKIKVLGAISEAKLQDAIQQTNKNQKSALAKIIKSHPPEKYNFIQLPCRQCDTCLQERTNEWKMRLAHESEMSEKNGPFSKFVTFTYEPKNLPPYSFLRYSDVQKALKRLRKKVPSFRYFVASEYGEKNNRPHYHILFFGLDLPDLKRENKLNGHAQFSSKILNEAWGKGRVQMGTLSEGGMKYVNNYLLKEQGPHQKWLIQEDWAFTRKQILFMRNWQETEEHYTEVIESKDEFYAAYADESLGVEDSKYISYWQEDGKYFVERKAEERKVIVLDTNEVVPIEEIPPFKKPLPQIRMSTNPGIGHQWLTENKESLWENLAVKKNGRKLPIPKYYQKKMTSHPDEKINEQLKDLLSAKKVNLGLDEPKTKEELLDRERKNRKRREFFYPKKNYSDNQ